MIKPHIVDEEAIKRRASLKPFGDIKEGKEESYTTIIDKPPVFTTANILDVEEESESDKAEYVYKPRYNPVKKDKIETGDIYIAKSRQQDHVSVKITNLPLEIDKRELEMLIQDKFGLFPLSTYVVIDRETSLSRGHAYVSFMSMDNAKDAVNKINGLVIEHSIIGAEIAKN